MDRFQGFPESSRKRPPKDYFYEGSDSDSDDWGNDALWRHKLKVRKVEPNIPQIVHLIWLGRQCGGTIPRERFANVVSLAKQFKASGWHVKIWTNNPGILYRAEANLAIEADSQYRGLALESRLSGGNSSRGKGKIEICSHQELCDELSTVNQQSYIGSQSVLNLPDWNLMGNEYANDTVEELKSSGSSRESSPGPDETLEARRAHLTKRFSEATKRSSPTPSLRKRLLGKGRGKIKPLHKPASHQKGVVQSIRLGKGGRVTGSPVKQQRGIRNLYKRNLLDFYLSHQVGLSNYAAAADFLRLAALRKYGGAYIDTDTQGAGFRDQYTPIFPALHAPQKVLFPIGWRSGLNNDLMASAPCAEEFRYIQLDQLYRCTLLERLPYSVWFRQRSGESKRVLVKQGGTGKGVVPWDYKRTAIQQFCTETLSLSDVARPQGYFYTTLQNAEPAVQQGLCIGQYGDAVDEATSNLRFSLTLYGPGPRTLNRMQLAMHLKDHQEILFKNLGCEQAQRVKSFDPEKTFSITRWGKLSRINTISWDEGNASCPRKSYSFDDSELEPLCSSMRH